MSKYMFILRSSDEANAANADVDFAEMLETMGRYNNELIEAGVLVAAEGLAPAVESVVLDFSSTPPVVTDGPYGETHELFDGFWIVDVANQEEAVAWARRIPVGAGVKIEVRRVPSLDEFPDDGYTRAERAWRERTGNL
ncbi:YciI family protein [Pseudolysinimonas sp.]|uniref:YciI family protein n=1 Tax=Pseudolysinimonas sp. TaxID=2680009 RepID=UPI003F80BEA5